MWGHRLLLLRDRRVQRFATHASWRTYCVGQGVVKGYDDGTYRPTEAVTRDQMAVYVARAFKLPL